MTPPSVSRQDAADPISDPLVASPGWSVDLSAWRMREYMSWDNACRQGQLVLITSLMSHVITAWPYPGKPGDLRAYAALDHPQWKAAVREVGRAVSAIFREAEDADLSGR
jgi:hypothetical protein